MAKTNLYEINEITLRLESSRLEEDEEEVIEAGSCS
jgi:hypothetical protein